GAGNDGPRTVLRPQHGGFFLSPIASYGSWRPAVDGGPQGFPFQVFTVVPAGCASARTETCPLDALTLQASRFHASPPHRSSPLPPSPESAISPSAWIPAKHWWR